MQDRGLPDTENFYAALPPIRSFDACLDDGVYEPLPDDWTVLISDVRQSTRAIADGHYKAVNMVGAATIVAVLNACDGRDLPYVFGGDGGTVIVPASLRRPAEDALRKLRAHCHDIFGLDLRVGAVSVAELKAAGKPMLVCKHALSAGNHLGFLSGEGHAYATALLKSDAPSNRYHLSSSDTANAPSDPPDLTSLSCRWEPFESRNGCILTLSVAPRTNSADTNQAAPARIIRAINDILDGDMRASAPANLTNLRFTWPPRGAWLEAVATAGKQSRIRRVAGVLASSFVQLICERLGIRLGPYDPKTYHAEMIANTDYRKLDGHMRLVLDVTEAQADAIEAYLATQARAHALYFGRHRAKSALMTCFVSSLAEGRHVHFIDGAGGGHTLAALDMKARADTPAT